MTILEEIVQQKEVELKALAASYTFDQLKKLAAAGEFVPRGFVASIRSSKFPAIIAEIKRASPSKGVFAEKLDPIQTAKDYEAADAACLSVLTDQKFFHGALEYLAAIRKAGVTLPMLRKDFVIDELQIWESRLAGADAVLLIVAILSDQKLEALLRESLAAGLDVLVEVHTEAELSRALKVFELFEPEVVERSLLLGINNRDLHTFETRLEVTEQLVAKIQRQGLLVVSESGLKDHNDLLRLQRSGVETFLIGESLIVSGDCRTALSSLIAGAREI